MLKANTHIASGHSYNKERIIKSEKMCQFSPALILLPRPPFLSAEEAM
jgi:hypothetical protein